MIPKDLKNAERVLRALSRLPLGIAREHEPAELIAKPFIIMSDMARVDVLTVAGKLKWNSAKADRQVREIDGVLVPYVGIDALIVSKETDRLQDRADVVRLLAIHDRRLGP